MATSGPNLNTSSPTKRPFGILVAERYFVTLTVVAIGLVVGLVVFYGILRGRVTWKDWVILAGVAFSTAAITFLRLGLTTLIVTPLVTLTAALVLRSKNLTQTRRG